jgi:transposase InsO family protein
LEWIHLSFQHPGVSKTLGILRPLVYWPGQSKAVTALDNACADCARSKPLRRGYGFLLGKLGSDTPFHTVHLDIVGPFSDKEASEDEHADYESLHCYDYVLSIIDSHSKWIELVPMKIINAENIVKAFDEAWLCRYLRPSIVITDNGKQFIAAEFRELLSSYGIDNRLTSTYNPQANAVVERVHGTIGNMIRASKALYWHESLPAICWALKAGYHQSLQSSTGELIFGRNMLQPALNVDRKALSSGANYLRDAQQTKDLQRHNKGRVDYNFKVDDFVYVQNPDPSKLENRFEGPYRILSVDHDHNTLTVENEDGEPYPVNFRRLATIASS